MSLDISRKVCLSLLLCTYANDVVITNKEENHGTEGESKTNGDDELGNCRGTPIDCSVHVAPYNGEGHDRVFSYGSVRGYFHGGDETC